MHQPQQRNTPQAPPLDRCTTCGSTRLDGCGEVTVFHNRKTCDDCRIGELDLVAEDPQNYEFAPDGTLRRKTPHPGKVETEATVTVLEAALTMIFEGLPGIKITVFNPVSGVAVILPNGYRWHVFIPGSGIYVPGAGINMYRAALLAPGPRMVGGFPVVVLDDLEDMLVAVAASLAPEQDIARMIADHTLTEMALSLADPDVLLTGNPPAGGPSSQ